LVLQYINSKYKDQKNTRPKIEDMVFEFLGKENCENAMAFISYLRENKMSIQWASTNSWKITNKGKNVAYFKLYNDSWFIDPEINYEDTIFLNYVKNEKLGKILQKNVEHCVNCLPNGQCSPGRTIEILGKQFINVCHSIRFINPQGADIHCIKKLFEYRKNMIAGNKVQKTFYVGKMVKNKLINQFGLSNFNLAYDSITVFINRDINTPKSIKPENYDIFLRIYSEIMNNNPEYNFLNMLEAGLKEYCKKMP